MIHYNRDLDTFMMKKVIELAALGKGTVNPEPLKGAVVVKGGRILGAGYNIGFGSPPAEIIAIKAAGSDAVNADLYLNLEPDFNDTNSMEIIKQAVKAGIKRIIIAMENPDVNIAGEWIKQIKQRGIESKCGVLKEEAERNNEVYIKHLRTGIPFVILKTAVSVRDGIAKSRGENQWITEAAAREIIKKTRSQVMGIMTGIGSILTDNPVFASVNHTYEKAKPVVLVLDSSLRLPLNSAVFKNSIGNRLIIACTRKADEDKMKAVERKGAKVMVMPEYKGKVDLQFLLKSIGSIGINSLLIEGGCRLSYSVLTEGIADKILCFTAPKILEGESFSTRVNSTDHFDNCSADIQLKDIQCLKIGRSIIIEGYNNKRINTSSVN